MRIEIKIRGALEEPSCPNCWTHCTAQEDVIVEIPDRGQAGRSVTHDKVRMAVAVKVSYSARGAASASLPIPLVLVSSGVAPMPMLPAKVIIPRITGQPMFLNEITGRIF